MTTTLNPSGADTARSLISKVPEVTIWFWIVKVLCTTVGETAADYLNVDLNLGMAATTMLMCSALATVLIVQFRTKHHVPAVYWLAVVLISVVGTLITDNLVDNLGVSLITCTVLFAAALAATFYAWQRTEHTLSIHSIYTAKREAFYWLAILFTFALGTATGDLVAEKAGLGYLNTGLIIAGLIGLIYVAHRTLGLAAIPAFWAVYILTRPLGASIGDYLSQAKADGGLGLGTTATSFVFLGAIAATVVVLNRRQHHTEHALTA
jgi:uncharacterized membrane-anchored protein